MSFIPTDLANLWGWWKADAGVTQASGNVSAWADQSGSGHNLGLDGVSGTPTISTGALNGLPAILSLLGSQAMVSSANIPVGDKTIFLLAKQLAGESSYGAFLSGQNNFSINRYGSAAKVVGDSGTGSLVIGAQENATDDTWYTIRFRITTATVYISVNNGVEVSVSRDATTVASLTSGLLVLFDDGTHKGKKAIVEAIIYTSSYTGNNSDLVEYYLNQRGLHYSWSGGIPTNDVTAVIAFPTLPTGKHVGDANFSPGATSNSPATITYVSSNTAVATIVSGQIHIVGVGTANITASQASTTGYTAATDVTHSLTIANIITMANVNTSAFGNVVTLAISTNLTTPAYKNIVCSTGNIGVAGKTEGGATVVTRCGIARAPGRNSQTISFEGIHNTTISSTTEVSANELAALSTSKAQFLVRAQDEGTPANYYRQGQGFISDYSETAAVDGFITFTGTIDVIGDLDLTP